jgi:hypothetical protein
MSNTRTFGQKSNDDIYIPSKNKYISLPTKVEEIEWQTENGRKNKWELYETKR